MDKNTTKALACKGLTTVLTALMTLGTFPVSAWALESDGAAAQEIVQPSLYGVPTSWKAGHTYKFPLSVWMNNSINGATVGMTKHYSDVGSVAFAQDGSLDYRFTILHPDKIQGVEYQGAAITPELVDDHAVYHLAISADELNNTTGIQTKMTINAMGGQFVMHIRSDIDNATDITPLADTSRLAGFVHEAEMIGQGNKSDEAWAAFEAALAAAQAVLNSSPTDQAVVDAAVNALSDAVTAFVTSPIPVTDITEGSAYAGESQFYDETGTTLSIDGSVL